MWKVTRVVTPPVLQIRDSKIESTASKMIWVRFKPQTVWTWHLWLRVKDLTKVWIISQDLNMITTLN